MNTRFNSTTLRIDGKEVGKLYSYTYLNISNDTVIHFHDGSSMNLTRLSKLMHEAFLNKTLRG
ncbi:hypothetical protein J2X61_004921 [Bacillus sp. 3255]|nr:hypothetical protein [Bacillus sp. 3255]